MGSPFAVNRTDAERIGDTWVVLSAKHGFVLPDTPIPGPYAVTFTHPSTGPVSVEALRRQAQALGLDQRDVIIGLGGQADRRVIEQVFAGWPGRLTFSFAGLPIGKALQATKLARTTGHPDSVDEADPSPRRS